VNRNERPISVGIFTSEVLATDPIRVKMTARGVKSSEQSMFSTLAHRYEPTPYIPIVEPSMSDTKKFSRMYSS